ncbi:MAG: hypothetical protein K6U87_06095 [Firmicutes bacterium]|nr:hypothetical protein [Bacillota bacterium]
MERVLMAVPVDGRRRLVLVQRETGAPVQPMEWVHWIEDVTTGVRELGHYHASLPDALESFAERCRQYGVEAPEGANGDG